MWRSHASVQEGRCPEVSPALSRLCLCGPGCCLHGLRSVRFARGLGRVRWRFGELAGFGLRAFLCLSGRFLPREGKGRDGVAFVSHAPTRGFSRDGGLIMRGELLASPVFRVRPCPFALGAWVSHIRLSVARRAGLWPWGFWAVSLLECDRGCFGLWRGGLVRATPEPLGSFGSYRPLVRSSVALLAICRKVG
jgi:hypothetical protein